MDPNTSTREEWTGALVSKSIPNDAKAQYKQYTEAYQTLYHTLAHHDAMVPNLQQTFMTPAASKNKVYFMWDFVGRTLHILLHQLPPTLDVARYNAQQREIWNDIISRTEMTRSLLTEPGMLDIMIESSSPDQRGSHPDLGPELVALANALPGAA